MGRQEEKIPRNLPPGFQLFPCAAALATAPPPPTPAPARFGVCGGSLGAICFLVLTKRRMLARSGGVGLRVRALPGSVCPQAPTSQDPASTSVSLVLNRPGPIGAPAGRPTTGPTLARSPATAPPQSPRATRAPCGARTGTRARSPRRRRRRRWRWRGSSSSASLWRCKVR